MNNDKVIEAYKEEIDYLYGEISNHDHKGSVCTCKVWYDELGEAVERRDEYIAEQSNTNVRDEHILSANDVL